jgi:hypothetical protein
VEDKDDAEAITKARKLVINEKHILRNLEKWGAVDSAQSVT